MADPEEVRSGGEGARAVRMVRDQLAEYGSVTARAEAVGPQLGSAGRRCGAGAPRPRSTRAAARMSRPPRDVRRRAHEGSLVLAELPWRPTGAGADLDSETAHAAALTAAGLLLAAAVSEGGSVAEVGARGSRGHLRQTAPGRGRRERPAATSSGGCLDAAGGHREPPARARVPGRRRRPPPRRRRP